MGKYRSTHTGQEIDTGVTKALNPDSVPSSGSSALITSDAVNKVQQGFAPIETASAAANNYAVDDLLVYNGVLYKAKTAIYIGDTLTVGTNIEATTVAEKLNNVDTQITANTDTTLTGLLKGNGSKVSAETRYIPTVEVTTAQYEALVAGGTVDPDVMYVITDDDSDVSNLATKANLASIQATGNTNSTGSTITNGTYFYLNGILVQAKADIASGATFTNGTNYTVVTAGALNELKSALSEYFTPNLSTYTTPTIFSSRVTVQKGGYKQVGNVVFVDLYITTTLELSASNWTLLNGLPYDGKYHALLLGSDYGGLAEVDTGGNIRVYPVRVWPTTQSIHIRGFYTINE